MEQLQQIELLPLEVCEKACNDEYNPEIDYIPFLISISYYLENKNQKIKAN